MKSIILASLLSIPNTNVSAAPENAIDASVKARLEAAGIKYEVDSDNDFKVTYSFTNDNRTQLLFIISKTESVMGITVREVYSPAARLKQTKINGEKALKLLRDSRNNKIGSWEIDDELLYYVIKVPDNINSEQLEAIMDIAAQTADDMERELTGRDDL